MESYGYFSADFGEIVSISGQIVCQKSDGHEICPKFL